MKLLHKIYFYLPNIFFLVVLLTTISIIISTASYLDITNFCYISIDGDVIRGNEKTIKVAIKNIKNNDYSTYENVCRNINKITEMYCPDPIDPLKFGEDIEGCYIKGSKIIYLKPNADNTSQLIEKRSETIIKLSKYSKKFWTDLQ